MNILAFFTPLILFIVAIVAYAIKDLQAQGKLKFKTVPSYSYWGSNSWCLKYKMQKVTNEPLVKAPNNWYYRVFKIKYKERWPTSTTLTVFLTDGWHLMQFVFINALCLGISLLFDRWIVTYVVIRAVWALIFNLSYKIFSKMITEKQMKSLPKGNVH